MRPAGGKSQTQAFLSKGPGCQQDPAPCRTEAERLESPRPDSHPADVMAPEATRLPPADGIWPILTSKLQSGNSLCRSVVNKAE